jgi:hypothetical protein
MPAHNQARFIGQAIRSVLAQSYLDWELVVVDDGSTDGTAEIARAFGDPRVRVLVQVQRGVCEARNAALAHSRSPYVALLDADDLYEPDKLQRHLETMDARPDVGLTYSSRTEIDGDGRCLGFSPASAESTVRDLLLGFPFAPSDVVVRRSLVDVAGPFRREFVVNEDRDWFVRLAFAGCRCVGLDRFLGSRRLHQGKVFDDLPARLADMERALQFAFEDSRCPPSVQAVSRAAHANVYLTWAYQAAIQGEHDYATTLFERALEAQPAWRRAPRDMLVELVTTSVRDGGDHERRLHRLFASMPTSWRRPLDVRDAVRLGYLLRGSLAVVCADASDGPALLSAARSLRASVASLVFPFLSGQLASLESAKGTERSSAATASLAGVLGTVGQAALARRLEGSQALNAAFSHHHGGRPREALRAVGRAIRLRPAYLANRGTLSVLLRSLVKGA